MAGFREVWDPNANEWYVVLCSSIFLATLKILFYLYYFHVPVEFSDMWVVYTLQIFKLCGYIGTVVCI
jgi:hypothetical protein